MVRNSRDAGPVPGPGSFLDLVADSPCGSFPFPLWLPQSTSRTGAKGTRCPPRNHDHTSLLVGPGVFVRPSNLGGALGD